MSPNPEIPTTPSLGAALAGRCPGCGKGKLFDGFLALEEKCDRCGLDFNFADAGDGPVFFIVLLVGVIVVGGALAVEMIYAPPYWVHAALWLPLTLVLTLGMMRPLKSLMVALQYRHRAQEGRLVR